MKTIAAVGSFIVLAVGTLAEPAFSQNGPKNLMSPTYRAPVAHAAVPHELTRKQVKRLAATAESAADHLKLANLLSSRGNSLEARATAYEKAAATLRNGPLVKNLTAPSTPGRYEFIAKGFRDEAKSDRSQAAAHEEMAGKSRASKSRGVRRSSDARREGWLIRPSRPTKSSSLHEACIDAILGRKGEMRCKIDFAYPHCNRRLLTRRKQAIIFAVSTSFLRFIR